MTTTISYSHFGQPIFGYPQHNINVTITGMNCIFQLPMEQFQVTSSPADGQAQVILQTMPAQMVASGTQSPGQTQVRDNCHV